MKSKLIIQEKSEEVEFIKSEIFILDNKELGLLKKKASYNKQGKYRICMHKSIEDEIHEMIIVHMSKTYVRPHKHRYNFESLQFIEGTCTVIFFDEKGTILNSFKAGEQNSQNIVYYKIPKDLYHMLIIDSKYLIFKETTKGPFIKKNTIFPNWAPDGSDKKEREEFISRIRMNIKNDN